MFSSVLGNLSVGHSGLSNVDRAMEQQQIDGVFSYIKGYVENMWLMSTENKPKEGYNKTIAAWYLACYQNDS